MTTYRKCNLGKFFADVLSEDRPHADSVIRSRWNRFASVRLSHDAQTPRLLLLFPLLSLWRQRWRNLSSTDTANIRITVALAMIIQGRVQDFSLAEDGRADNRGRTAEGRERGIVLGEGQQAPPHQLQGLGSAVSSRRGVGWSPDRPKVSTIFSTEDGLSWHYNTGNCGLSCSDWRGKTPVLPPWVRPCDHLWLHPPNRLCFCVCAFACLSVSGITQKVVEEFWWNF